MTWFQTVILDLQTYTQLMNRKNQVCFSILNILSYRSLYTALLPVLQRNKVCYNRLSKTHESDCSEWIFYMFLVCFAHISARCH